MVRTSAVDRLTKLLSSEIVVDLPRIEAALGGVSSMNVFRYLKKVPYRRSYNYNGRYYCLHEPDRYDQLGLWSWKDIHFSVDNSLRSTVKRLVYTEAEECPVCASPVQGQKSKRRKIFTFHSGVLNAREVRKKVTVHPPSKFSRRISSESLVLTHVSEPN